MLSIARSVAFLHNGRLGTFSESLLVCIFQWSLFGGSWFREGKEYTSRERERERERAIDSIDANNTREREREREVQDRRREERRDRDMQATKPKEGEREREGKICVHINRQRSTCA